MAAAVQRMGVYTMTLGTVPPLLSALNTVLILYLGSLRVIDGQMTVGMLVAFQGLMVGFADPVNQLVGLGGSLQEIEGEMTRLDDVLRYPADALLTGGEKAAAAGADAPVKLSGHLELKGVTYGYSRLDPPLIEGFGLSMTPGMRIALVGFSASGKSTMAKLISGVYQPWSGDVLLDGGRGDRNSRALWSAIPWRWSIRTSFCRRERCARC